MSVSLLRKPNAWHLFCFDDARRMCVLERSFGDAVVLPLLWPGSAMLGLSCIVLLYSLFMYTRAWLAEYYSHRCDDHVLSDRELVQWSTITVVRCFPSRRSRVATL
jgi:hypothetical protein